MLLWDAGGCDDGSATRCTRSRTLSSLADSDPKARSALRIRKEGKSTQFTSMASLGRIGDTAQSVRASDARPWLQSDDATILIPQRNNFDSRMQQF